MAKSSLRLMWSFLEEVAQVLGQYASADLSQPEKADYFLGMAYPDLEAKMELALRNLRDAQTAGLDVDEAQAHFWHCKGMFHHFSLMRTERAMLGGFAFEADAQEQRQKAREALERALSFGGTGNEYREQCWWLLAEVASSEGNSTGETEALHQVVSLDGKRALEAARIIQERALEEERSSDKGAGCFIATAAYGRADRPEVMVLRRFRDMFLVKSGPGRRLVSLYYRLSPRAARWIEPSGPRRRVARTAISPLVSVAGWFLSIRRVVCCLRSR